MRDPSSEEKKVSQEAVLAAYLNTAKNNIELVMEDLFKNIDKYFPLFKEYKCKKLAKAFLVPDYPDLQVHIIERFNRCIPSLHHLAFYEARREAVKGADEKESIVPAARHYYRAFMVVRRAIRVNRNFYTHAVHKKVITPKSIIEDLEGLFDLSRRTIKERFKLDPGQMEHLVRLGRDKKERQDFHYSFKKKNSDELSLKGLLFLISLFLEKRDAQEMLKKNQGFKKSETPDQKATLEAFTCHCLKLPKNKLKSDDKDDALILNVFNELVRCPNELYKVLSEKNKNEFIKQKNEYDEYDAGTEDDEYSPTAVLKRSGNRFYYFALRYLEKNIPGIKFQIDLGNYCYHSYNQEINGTEHRRRYFKKTTSFGQLNAFSKDKCPDDWKEKIWNQETDADNPPGTYLTETPSHYDMNGQNIGIIFKEDLASEPEWGDLPEYDPLKKGPKRKNVVPRCWLSLYELPAMVFYSVLHTKYNGNASRNAENIIRNYYNNMGNLLDDIIKGQIVDEDMLNKKIKNYYLNKKDIPKFIINHFKSESRGNGLSNFDIIKKDTETRLQKAENLRKGAYKEVKGKKIILRPGNKDYTEIKAGRIADFLARDMVRFQKPDYESKNNGKANSTEFQLLQANLALFETGKKSQGLYSILEKCRLISKDNPNPFLDDKIINDSESLLDFYIKYLERKKNWLSQNENNIHFLQKVPGSFESQIKKMRVAYGEKDYVVFNLPRGLFLENIKKLIKSKFNREYENITSPAYIIEDYFKNIQRDNPQSFYGYKRTYKIINLLQNIIDNNPGSRNSGADAGEYSISEMTERKDDYIAKIPELCRRNKYKCEYKKECLQKGVNVSCKYLKEFKNYLENEKQIRLYKTCDMVLSLMLIEEHSKLFSKSKDVRGNNYINSSTLKLGNISPVAKNILDIPLGETSIKVMNKVITNDCIKIKNYGEFKAAVNDRRLNSLLPYISEEKIDYKKIQKELIEYNRVKDEIFDMIHTFEKEVLKEVGLEVDGNGNVIQNGINDISNILIKAFKEEGYISHSNIIDAIKKKLPAANPDILNEIIEIRNAFSHGNYPEIGKMTFSVNSLNRGMFPIATKFKGIIGSHFETILGDLKAVVEPN
jgi:hypothetical protein